MCTVLSLIIKFNIEKLEIKEYLFLKCLEISGAILKQKVKIERTIYICFFHITL